MDTATRAYPQDMTHIPWVLVAGVIGFFGNEIVARFRISVGRRIGSAALVADGLHARTDGFTSLAVVLAAGGARLGWRWADAVVGLLITVAIAFVLRDAAREVYRRLMDRVDPELVDQAEQSLRAIPGVDHVSVIKLRWIGHRMHAAVGHARSPSGILAADVATAVSLFCRELDE